MGINGKLMIVFTFTANLSGKFTNVPSAEIIQTKFTITENRLSRIFWLLESLFSFTSKSVDIVAHAESGFMKRILFFPVFTE